MFDMKPYTLAQPQLGHGDPGYIGGYPGINIPGASKAYCWSIEGTGERVTEHSIIFSIRTQRVFSF